MGNLGSFKRKNRPEAKTTTVDFYDVELTVSMLDGGTILDFTDTLIEQNSMSLLVESNKLLKSAFGDAGFSRFRKICRDERVEADELVELALAIYSWATGFPTVQPIDDSETVQGSESSTSHTSDGQSSNDPNSPSSPGPEMQNTFERLLTENGMTE